ncbi:MAG: hypothetical protein IPH89_09960 [Bacteroidetes bacterium]|nr:hypothetical protein [Bacteroidota bacterium]
MKKVVRHILIVASVLLSILASAQEASERGNLSNYYNEKLHFGFTIGVNRTNFIIQNAQHFERFDSLKWIHSTPKQALT